MNGWKAVSVQGKRLASRCKKSVSVRDACMLRSSMQMRAFAVVCRAHLWCAAEHRFLSFVFLRLGITDRAYDNLLMAPAEP